MAVLRELEQETKVISMVKENESPLHAWLVELMVAEYQRQGYMILSAADGQHNAPPKIGRHEPDILAKQRDGEFRICEAKTGEGDLTTEHTAEQFRDFSSKKAVLDIIVPKEKVAELEQTLRELGVKDEQRGLGTQVTIRWPD
jgi:hypothetical protein